MLKKLLPLVCIISLQAAQLDPDTDRKIMTRLNNMFDELNTLDQQSCTASSHQKAHTHIKSLQSYDKELDDITQKLEGTDNKRFYDWKISMLREKISTLTAHVSEAWLN